MTDLKKANLAPEDNFVNIRAIDDDAQHFFLCPIRI